MLDYIKNNPVAGTYQYINNDSGALYIGSANNIWERYLGHLRTLDVDVAIANEGIENFTFKILDTFPIGTDKNILRQNERKWIDYFDAENNPLHYNKPCAATGTIKYSLWDPIKVYYRKHSMFHHNENGERLRRCFSVNSPTQQKGKQTYRLPIGLFHDPYTPTLLYDLSQQWS